MRPTLPRRARPRTRCRPDLDSGTNTPEPRKANLKCFKDFHLTAKARIGPRQSYVPYSLDSGAPEAGSS